MIPKCLHPIKETIIHDTNKKKTDMSLPRHGRSNQSTTIAWSFWLPLPHLHHKLVHATTVKGLEASR